MSDLLDELSKKAKELAVEERAQLAQELMESVDQESDPEIEAAWETEIASRVVKYERVDASEVDDPVLGQFLGFLALDIASHPERLQTIDSSFVQRLQSLTGGIEVDLDAPLSVDDE